MNDPIEELNRSAKLFVDSGAAATVEDAMERLQAFRLHIVVGERASQSPTLQAALFTALNCGRRMFLGGVTVSGALGAPLAVSVMPTGSLADAVVHFRGQIVEEAPPGVPVIAIGTTFDAGASFAVRATFDGWRGGVVPGLAKPLCEASEFALSGVLAGALGVTEAFAHLNGEAMAGSRSVGMSLWDLAPGDWRSQEADGPPPEVLPADFWLIGLGHLGQAFLWAIGLLPYPDPSAVRVFLQEVDTVGVSTESTSVLSTVYHRGEMKTRVCGEWASARGFEVRMVERRFGADLRVAPDEPALALCGVDNPQARELLEGAGFANVFEAGLGDGASDFRLIRTHSFPAPVGAAAIWANRSTADAEEERQSLPSAYRDLRDRGKLDQCGLTRLAEVAVGAPFVGMVAAAVVVAQVIRMTVDGMRPTVCNLDLTCLQHRSVVMREGNDAIVFKTTKA